MASRFEAPFDIFRKSNFKNVLYIGNTLKSMKTLVTMFLRAHISGTQKSVENPGSREETEEEKKTKEEEGKTGRVNPFRDSPPDLGDDLPIVEGGFVLPGVFF